MGTAQKTIRIKWVRSGIGFDRSQSEVVRSLGLRRLNHVVERPDTPQLRGLVAKVAHLVELVSQPPEPGWPSTPAYVIKAAVPRTALASGEGLASPGEAESSGSRNLQSEILSTESLSSRSDGEARDKEQSEKI